ncbi:hypothetical protein CDL12_17049 [Handroanthus impetiginosus]|uniref:RING-type E3 ubiquitin transferase n=1 Tax=Handroanthus impetiginosus TaxID=429701 RepID=A0A2G9GYK2_9LAMI|nr:hypothetical protein CDL12_17049 [Handroanthus impetiginosus]
MNGAWNYYSFQAPSFVAYVVTPSIDYYQLLNNIIQQPDHSDSIQAQQQTSTKHLKTTSVPEVKTSADQDEICVVCQDFLSQLEQDNIATLDCGHKYHKKCINNWLMQKNSCPLCKAYVIHIDIGRM